jgi:hypothetical protein
VARWALSATLSAVTPCGGKLLTTHTLSHETREALDNLKAYLSSENEAVQYEFSYLANLVTQTPSVILGGIQAGALPPNDIATDPAGEAFSVGPGATGPFPASISLNLDTGEVSASWTIQSTTSSITGYVRRVADLDAPPSDRFMFVIPQHDAGFYVLTTTNL